VRLGGGGGGGREEAGSVVPLHVRAGVDRKEREVGEKRERELGGCRWAICMQKAASAPPTRPLCAWSLLGAPDETFAFAR
jgi:hypothetical protein